VDDHGHSTRFLCPQVPSDVSISGSLHTEQSRLVDVTALKHRPQFPFSFPNSPTYTLYTGIYVDSSGTKSSTIEPISFKLTSLDAFFENTYWTDDANEFPSSCPRDISRTISVKRQNLVQALQVYGARKGAFAPVGNYDLCLINTKHSWGHSQRCLFCIDYLRTHTMINYQNIL